MKDLARRFPGNPLLIPQMLAPSRADLKVICLLNPGVFTFQNKVWLLVRVAENFSEKEGVISLPIHSEIDGLNIFEVFLEDPDLISTDSRVVNYKGLDYLTTRSHLRLFCSSDGLIFNESDEYPPLLGIGKLESCGIEDCRVSKINDTYYLTYTAVSPNGVGVGMRTTQDWKHFESPQMIFPPHNKDCALFEEKINGKFYALHRPSSKDIGGNFIWIAQSPDGIHWGKHLCILTTRANLWDSARVGSGGSPIKTPRGWLEIYHGADSQHRYCLGAFLMELNNPANVIARSQDPIMEPLENYELNGFFGQVVFTNGHITNGDKLTIYYGAADEYVCGATFSIEEILDSLIFS